MTMQGTGKTKSTAAPVPEARPMISGTASGMGALSAIDNDLAIANLENDFDMTAADLQDFKRQGL